jgi:hypothetical protein
MMMEEQGIVGSADGAKPRDVLSNWHGVTYLVGRSGSAVSQDEEDAALDEI